MDLSRMLEKSRDGQWSVGDLDWTVPVRQMSLEDETAIVQYFTDMAWIERLAGALFEEQRKRVDDPVLQEIFTLFVEDEVRHSHAAQMLADHYNRRKLHIYQPNTHLLKFSDRFVEALRYLNNDIANAYITGGELVLDIALLRSINEYVDDEMSQQVMDLINRDESRHIAIDYHMSDFYTSEAYRQKIADAPSPPLPERLRAWRTFAAVLYHAAPFFRDVFFRPMDVVDPTGRRMRQAFKRIQLLSRKGAVKQIPFVRFMTTMQDLHNHPVTGRLFGRVLQRIIGVDASVLTILFEQEELDQVQRMSFDELAQEALQAKYAH